jgi:hypothetical protein
MRKCSIWYEILAQNQNVEIVHFFQRLKAVRVGKIFVWNDGQN